MSITDPPTHSRTIGHGRYTLLQELGRGGAGIVWRGEDQRIQRPVAIKEATAAQNLSEQERDVTINRILREVRAAGGLNHPATVTIHDVLWENDTIYIVMELVDGSSLSEILNRTGPMQPQWATRIALEVLDALTTAHGAGIIHRDIKPSNIMLPSSDAPAKLADFGLAWMNSDTKLTQTGMIVGSPAYLAPEQISGDPVTSATDLWQLGVTLYRMLHGSSPFSRADQQSTLFAILGHKPMPLDCGEPLSSAIAALLEKLPDQRPTAAQLRPVLEQCAASSRSSEGTTSTRRIRRTWRWRGPAKVVGATMAMACAVGAGVVLDRTVLAPRAVSPAVASQASRLMSWDSINTGVIGENPESVDMTEIDFEKTGCTEGKIRAGSAVQETVCNRPHSVEIFDSYKLPTTPGSYYPQNIDQAALDYCEASFATYGHEPWLDGHDIVLTALPPSDRRWHTNSEFRNVLYCAVHSADGGKFTGSELKTTS